VFHEVRVPLNTALLAVQNMEAEGAIPKGQELEFTALTGSLSMMSKVLNDVLDLYVLLTVRGRQPRYRMIMLTKFAATAWIVVGSSRWRSRLPFIRL
jgi:signal transduction histidine kinase